MLIPPPLLLSSLYAAKSGHEEGVVANGFERFGKISCTCRRFAWRLHASSMGVAIGWPSGEPNLLRQVTE